MANLVNQTGWVSLSPAVAPVLASTQRLGKKESYIFEKAYHTLVDAHSVKWVREGLVVATVGSGATRRYVPYVSDASYGTGSDTPTGILTERIALMSDGLINTTLMDVAVTPIYSGEVADAYVYTIEDGIGAVPAAVKAALPLIYFKEA